MTQYEFHAREIDWALAILAAPAYVMLNGRDSHAVATDVLHAADDALLEIGVHYTANGQRSRTPSNG